MYLRSVAIAAVATSGLLLAGPRADADVIVGYTSTNTTIGQPSIAPTTTGTGVTGIDLARGSGLNQGPGVTFNSSGFDAGNASAADAITDNDFLTFGFTSSVPFDLSDLDIRYDRSSSGPSKIVIQIDVGSGFNTFFTDTSVSTLGETQLDIDLSSIDNMTAANFRIVGFAATDTSGGIFDLENNAAINNGEALVVNGTVVPETGSFMLLGLGGLFTLIRRRWQRPG